MKAIGGHRAIGSDVVEGVEDLDEDVEAGFGDGDFGGGEAFDVVSGWVGWSGGCVFGCGGGCFFVFVFVVIVLGARFLGGDGGEGGIVDEGLGWFGGGDGDGLGSGGLG